MIQEKDIWKIDGIICGDTLFNMPKSATLKPYMFHSPHYETEKALDAILKQEIDDLFTDQDNYENRGQSGYVEKQVEMYPNTFSPALITAWKKASMEVPQKRGEYCNYKKLCNSDYDPVTCTADNPDYFFFRQERANDYEAIVVTSWPWSGEVLGTYKLVKVHAKWQLDGIACGGNEKFNMP
jgi:hypothetical protein